MSDRIFSVNEIFSSIDGEGIRTGYLTTFIRLNGCNLKCSYCDTKYAQKPEKPNYSIDEILAKVKEIGNQRITLTGGEPLIHNQVKLLVENLSFLGYEVNIETNGAVPLPDSFCKLPGVIITMDWKCPSSGCNKAMNKGNLQKLTCIDVLKFVVGTEEDLQEALRIYKMGLPCYFYLSPVFGEMEPKRIVEFMKENNMQFATVQVQLHKIIWDPNERGV